VDTCALFHKISQRMRADFEASAQVGHSGSKGTVRENILREFLSERLPAKYGLGAGEIVGRIRETSKQSDIVVYDKLNGVRFLVDESVQVFPIDCVYGIIEVKSALSKTEFLDALEKIKALKSLAPGGNVAHPMGGGMTMFHARPRPFGMVFAYSLAGNSLDSLQENLCEWEENTPPTLWPNYICVLETGVILHHGQPFETCLGSDKITAKSWPISLSYGQDSLFQFFCSLHDVCARMNLGPVELHHYYERPEKIGSHVVQIRPMTRVKDGRKVRPSAKMIDKIVSWCASRGPIRYDELLQKRFGSVPLGMEKIAPIKVFLYNSDDLPGLREIEGPPLEMTDEGPKTKQPCLMNILEFTIDGENYAVATDGFADDDFEEVE
jgi:hypothetical protein